MYPANFHKLPKVVQDTYIQRALRYSKLPRQSLFSMPRFQSGKRKRTYTKTRKAKKRKNYRQKQNLKKWGRKKIVNNNRLVINRAKIGLPSMQVVRLLYTDGRTVGDSVATNASLIFRLRGAFDPGLSAGAAQPVGWSTWLASGLYTQYRVARVSYSVACEHLDQSTTVTRAPVVIGVMYRSDSASIPVNSEMSTFVSIDRSTEQPVRGVGLKVWPAKRIIRNPGGFETGVNQNPLSRLGKNLNIYLGSARGENMKKVDISQPYGNPSNGARNSYQQLADYNDVPLDDTYLGVQLSSTVTVLPAGTVTTLLPLPYMGVLVRIWYTMEMFGYSAATIT